MRRVGRVLAAALVTAGLSAAAGWAELDETPTPWPRDLWDPAAASTPADLVLPMPCGAAMAFQKVDVPVDADDPLADRRLRLGQSLDSSGYADYLRPAFLRGPFSDPGSGTTHYYIARYELTAGQFRVLQGDCSEPARRDRLAQGGLSWFDAVDVARLYSEWLNVNAADTLPKSGDAAGFARLPTEAEWEYATRGGARADAGQFPGLTFFGDGEMRDFALHLAPGSARGKLGAIGLRRPNPLGLYDVYGNAEELVLEPFRLNVVGRVGGQLGGIVTRGGSVLSTADEIYSAQRTEYPPFDRRSGAPFRSPTVGMRLVLAAHITTSDSQLRAIRDRWAELAGTAGNVATGSEDTDPAARLAKLIEGETDPGRARALTGLQLELRRSRDQAQSALQQSARATLLTGAVFVETLIENAERIEDKAANIRMLVDLQRAGNKSDVFDRQVQGHVDQIGQMRRLQTTYLLSFRTALETLSTDIPPEMRDVAYAVLREELSLSGQTGSLDMLDRFWADLAIYRGRPDISPDDLLKVALQ